MNDKDNTLGTIMNFLSVILGAGFSTGHEDTLKDYPELGMYQH